MYLFKVNIKNRKRYEVCLSQQTITRSKLTIKTLEQGEKCVQS